MAFFLSHTSLFSNLSFYLPGDVCNGIPVRGLIEEKSFVVSTTMLSFPILGQNVGISMLY